MNIAEADMPRTADGRVILGRRPYWVKWAPSKPLPWWCGAWQKDHRFTIEQEEALAKLRLDPATVEAMEVRREWNNYTDDAGQVRRGQLWPVYVFDCPVVERSGDVVVVIGPDGKLKRVRSDGWAHKPRKNPYWGF